MRIDLNWWQRLLAFHFSTMEIPLAHIEGVGTERVKTHWSERRIPGSFIPGLLKAGTYRRSGRKDFWCVARSQPLLRLDLRNEYFNSLNLGMEDSQHWASQLATRIPEASG